MKGLFWVAFFIQSLAQVENASLYVMVRFGKFGEVDSSGAT